MGFGIGEFRFLRGIVVDRFNGCILVCDSENNCVYVFKLDGIYVVNFEIKKILVGIDLFKGKKVVVLLYYGYCV